MRNFAVTHQAQASLRHVNRLLGPHSAVSGCRVRAGVPVCTQHRGRHGRTAYTLRGAGSTSEQTAQFEAAGSAAGTQLQQQQQLQEQVASLTTLALSSQQNILSLASQMQQVTTQLRSLEQQQQEQQQHLATQQLQWQQTQAQELQLLKNAVQQQQLLITQALDVMQKQLLATQPQQATVNDGAAVQLQQLQDSPLQQAPELQTCPQQQQQHHHHHHQQQQTAKVEDLPPAARTPADEPAAVATATAEATRMAASLLSGQAAPQQQQQPEEEKVPADPVVPEPSTWCAVTVPPVEELDPAAAALMVSSLPGTAEQAAACPPTPPAAAVAGTGADAVADVVASTAAAELTSASATLALATAPVAAPPAAEGHPQPPTQQVPTAADSYEPATTPAPPLSTTSGGVAAAGRQQLDTGAALQQCLGLYQRAASSSLDAAAAQEALLAVRSLSAVDPGSWPAEDAAKVLFVAAVSKDLSRDAWRPAADSAADGLPVAWLERLTAAATATPATAACSCNGPGTFWAAVQLKGSQVVPQEWLAVLSANTQLPLAWSSWWKGASPQVVVGYALAALTHPLLAAAARGSSQLLLAVQGVVEQQPKDPEVQLGVLLVLQVQGYHVLGDHAACGDATGSSGAAQGKAQALNKKGKQHKQQQKGAVGKDDAQKLQQMQQQLFSAAIGCITSQAQQGVLPASTAAAAVGLLSAIGWFAAAGAAADSSSVSDVTPPQQVLLEAAAAECGSPACSLSLSECNAQLSAMLEWSGPEEAGQLLEHMLPHLQQLLQQSPSPPAGDLAFLFKGTAQVVAAAQAAAAAGPGSTNGNHVTAVDSIHTTTTSTSSSGREAAGAEHLMAFLQSVFILLNNHWSRLRPEELQVAASGMAQLQVPWLQGCNLEAYGAAAQQALQAMALPVHMGAPLARQGSKQQGPKGAAKPPASAATGSSQLLIDTSPAAVLVGFQRLYEWTGALAQSGQAGSSSQWDPEQYADLVLNVYTAAMEAYMQRAERLKLSDWTLVGDVCSEAFHLPDPPALELWCQAFLDATQQAEQAAAGAGLGGPTVHDAVVLLELLHFAARQQEMDPAAAAEASFRPTAALLKALQLVLGAQGDQLTAQDSLSCLLGLGVLLMRRSKPAAPDAACAMQLFRGAAPALSEAPADDVRGFLLVLRAWWRPGWAVGDMLQGMYSVLEERLEQLELLPVLGLLDRLAEGGEQLSGQLLQPVFDRVQHALQQGLLPSSFSAVIGSLLPLFKVSPPSAALLAELGRHLNASLMSTDEPETAADLLMKAWLLQLKPHPAALLHLLEQQGDQLDLLPEDAQVQILSSYASWGAPTHPILQQMGSQCLREFESLAVSHMVLLGQACADLLLVTSAEAQKVCSLLQRALQQMADLQADNSKGKGTRKGMAASAKRQQQKQARVTDQEEMVRKALEGWTRVVEAVQQAEAKGVTGADSSGSYLSAWEAYVAAEGPVPGWDTQGRQQQRRTSAAGSAAVGLGVDDLAVLQEQVMRGMQVPVLDAAAAEALFQQAAGWDAALGLSSGDDSDSELGPVIDV